MIRFIFLIGVLVGIVLTKTFSWGLEAYLRYRENRTIEKARNAAIRVRIDEAPTEDLLNEISTRDDISRASTVPSKGYTSSQLSEDMENLRTLTRLNESIKNLEKWEKK